MESVEQSKPGIAGETPASGIASATPVLPGASPRGPLPAIRRLLPVHLGIRLTDDLRGALRKRAMADGISDSAMVRRLLLEVLNVDSDPDRVSGVTVPPMELAAASRMLGTLTTFIVRAHEAGEANRPGIIAAMEAAHKRLVRIIERLETRS